jgi:uncharacterized protein (DUF305 family)
MTLNGSKRHVRLLLATLALSGVLAACGGGGDEDTAQESTTGQDAQAAQPESSAEPAASGEFNDADVLFVQTMIPHHEQALKMSELAAKNASREEVKKLAADIEAAQQPEIDKMRGWLKDWGRTESDGAMAGMDHSAGGMAGMMPDEHMQAMEKATGADFEKMFLEMMIEHHRGAVEAAKTEQAQGKNADVKALAADVEADQTAEIERIQKLLDSK